MTTRPAAYPYWTDGNPAKVTIPDGASALQGFTAGEPPPFQYVNYLFYTLSAWIQYLDQITNTGLNNALIRLINGGEWSFDATTGALSWSATANLAIPSLNDAANAFAAGSVTLNDGDIAYCVANMPSSSLGDTNTSTNPDEIVNMNYTGNVAVGYDVTGPGIPNGTTVLGVASNSVLLSQDVTSDNSQATYVFSPPGGITVQTSSNTALVPTLNTILLARRAGNVIYLGVNCSQMVIRDGEFKTLIGSGYFSLYQAVAGQNLTAGTLVYISPGSADAGRSVGALYPLDVSAANQAIRGIYAGVIITDVTTGNQATVVYSGFYEDSGLTPGAVYYADPNNPGGITASSPESAGSKILPVAFALTTSIILYIGAQFSLGGQQFPIFGEDESVGDATKTAYPLSETAASENSVFAFVDGGIIPNTQWTFASNTVTFTTPPPLGATVEFKYILASQTYLAGDQAIPTNPSGDLTNFVLPFVPVSQASTNVYVGGGIIPSSQWSLTIGEGLAQVSLKSALGVGQSIYVTTLSASAAGSGGGSGGLTGGQNAGSGVGVFDDVVGSLAQFFSLVAGSGVTIAYNGTGGIVISATGGGGGAIEAHGSFGSPVALNPAAGLVPTSANDQVWFVTTTSVSSGASPITSTPQFVAGTVVGQRLTVFGITNGNGGYLSVANGNGVLQNGNFTLPTGQCLVYMWNGSAWQFISNAI